MHTENQSHSDKGFPIRAFCFTILTFLLKQCTKNGIQHKAYIEYILL